MVQADEWVRAVSSLPASGASHLVLLGHQLQRGRVARAQRLELRVRRCLQTLTEEEEPFFRGVSVSWGSTPSGALALALTGRSP